ncbi:hypothetical protein EBR44_14915, partial [bacterium]|nr:hypothetical protein [bacterium]
QDPQFPRNLAGGVTTIQVLPGSGNLIGGRSVVLKVVPGRSVQEMKFPGAKYGLKMACGENPMRVYQARGPATRMGNIAGDRAAWINAEAYRRRWDNWLANKSGDPPQRDLGLETLAEVLRGNILVHNHCYMADEMLQMIDVIAVSEEDAIRWLTINPAWALGLDDKIGSLVPGKNADVVLWSGNPFSIYTKAEKVWIDGAMLFDRTDPKQQWRTDFELGFVPANMGGNK